MSQLNKHIQAFYDLFDISLSLGLHRQDIDLAQLQLVQQTPAYAYATPDAQSVIGITLAHACARRPLTESAFGGVLAHNPDVAADAYSGYWSLAKALMGQVSLAQLADLPAAKLQQHRATLRALVNRGVFIESVHDYVTAAAMPPQMQAWHASRFAALQNKVLRTPPLFLAARRVLNYKGLSEPYERYVDDLNLLHRTVASLLNNIQPQLVFNDCAADKLGGKAHKTILREADMQRPGWRHQFFNNVYIRDTKGNRLPGKIVLDKMMHELLHSKEDGMIERVMGKTNALMHPRQRRYFKQAGLDAWPLKKMAVLLALNCSILGQYVGVTTSELHHYGQLRERHARWFAASVTGIFETCVQDYAHIRNYLVSPHPSLHNFRQDVLSFLTDAPAQLAARNMFMPSVADICAQLPLADIAADIAALDVNDPHAAIAISAGMTRLEASTLQISGAGEGWTTVPDNRTDWALSEIQATSQKIRTTAHLLSDLMQGKPMPAPHVRPFNAYGVIPAGTHTATPAQRVVPVPLHQAIR